MTKVNNILPYRYRNKIVAGVTEDIHNGTIAFWPAFFTGAWPEAWNRKTLKIDPVCRQVSYKLLEKLAAEATDQKLGNKHFYPLGKDTHQINLVLHKDAPTPNVLGVVLKTNPDTKLAICDTYAELVKAGIEKDGIHLGYVPKHQGYVAKYVNMNLSYIQPGRITHVTEYLYGGTPENRTKKAVTARVIFPYGGSDPFNTANKLRLAKRFNQLEEEDEDSGCNSQGR